MRLNNKGYLLVEIILASALAIAIAYLLIELTIKLKNNNEDLLVRSLTSADQAIIYNYFAKKQQEIDGEIIYDNISVSADNKTISYNGEVIVKLNKYALFDSILPRDRIPNTKIFKTIAIPIYVPALKDDNFEVVIFNDQVK